MDAAKHTDEVVRVGVTDALSDDVDSLIGVEKSAPRFCEATRDDPLEHSLTRGLFDRCRDVRRGPFEGVRDVTERDRLEAILFDEAKRATGEGGTELRRGAHFLTVRAGDLGEDERQEALGRELRVTRARAGGLALQLSAEPMERFLTIGRDSQNRGGAETDAGEGGEEPFQASVSEARWRKPDAPGLGALAFDEAVTLAARDDKDITCFH